VRALEQPGLRRDDDPGGRQMTDATISRVQMRDLARLGRFPPGEGRVTAFARACASRREGGPEASSVAAALPSRPRAAGSRPGGGDLVASTI
jgi:hypothetical protein